MNRGEINKQAAFRNMVLKKEIIQLWCVTLPKTQSGELEYFPTTIRQFNAWDLHQNSDCLRECLPVITKNANDTLRNYPSLRAEVQTAITTLKRSISKANDKSSRPAKLAEKIRDLETYQHALEVELITLRLERADWLQRSVASDEKYKALLSEFHKAQALSLARYEEVVTRNAELQKLLSKVTGLKAVSKCPR